MAEPKSKPITVFTVIKADGTYVDVPLIEDVCESHGATFQGRKLGSFGFLSNFSFYYAHHLPKCARS